MRGGPKGHILLIPPTFSTAGHQSRQLPSQDYRRKTRVDDAQLSATLAVCRLGLAPACRA